LQLTLVEPRSAPRTVSSLDAQGALRNGTFGPATLLGTLDSRGCFVADGETIAEVTSDGNVWTEHQRFYFVGSELRLPGHRRMRVGLDGTVETRILDGGVVPTPFGRFAFTNYSARASCAARMMLAVFFAGMSFSDGHPRREPVPADSQCPHSPARGDGAVSPSGAIPTPSRAGSTFAIATVDAARAALFAAPDPPRIVEASRVRATPPTIVPTQTPTPGCTRGTLVCRWIFVIDEHTSPGDADRHVFAVDPFDGRVTRIEE
jgi:hypothetical protein